MKFIRVYSRYLKAALIPIFYILIGYNVPASQSNDPFPLYPSIKSNVAFWKKIYSEYTTSQGIIHDRRHLDIIYQVIPLKDSREPGAAKYNEKQIKETKNYYKKLLMRLSTGKSPQTEEERRLHAIFVDHDALKALGDAYRYIRFQLGQKDRFRDGIIRSGAYIEEIRNIFEAHGMPADLAYIPHVESSFNYEAYSKFGAAGIWQFTHSTGKRYMTINYTVDERRDPILASRAAAQFLKKNYEALGSWPLAITAYNHGTNGMIRAKKSKGDYETIFNDYNSRSFGFASRNFYSEFLAAREIAKDYQLYFADIKPASPIRRQYIVMQGYIDLPDLMDHFQVEEETFKSLNPALRTPVFSSQKYIPKGYRLYLPIETASNQRYELSRIPAELYKQGQKLSRFYRVQRGDTAGKIAQQHRVPLNDLIQANRLDPRATIYVGQNLRIPVKGEKVVVASAVEPEPAKKIEPIIHKPDETTEEKVVLASSAPLNTLFYIRKLKQYETSEPTHALDIESGLVNEQDLPLKSVQQIEEKGQVNPAVVMGNFSVEQIITQKDRVVGLIRVEAEETLGHYADWLQIPTQRIRDLNGLPYGRPIQVGQKIEIPFGKITPEQFEEKRYEYHKEMEEDFFAVYSVKESQSYKIEKGDNIWTLCLKKFDLPFWLLKKYNADIDFQWLMPSQELFIPVVAKIGNGSDLSDPDDDTDDAG
ncbi:MAG: transglycosylase SLT domain-containing protein [Deltaproteobacteria bacterium]|nr:transglycosylase SLT domain-containing protein [Deltaproteobacteria bacterium]